MLVKIMKEVELSVGLTVVEDPSLNRLEGRLLGT